MASMGNFNREFTADEINRVPLPASLPCKECGRDKSPQSFAKRHLRDYQYQKANNRGYVPTVRNTTARCRKCTGEQVHELKCEGQCGLWKSLDEYSKNQRTRGEKWCKQCVLWKSSLEPGTSAVAAPNGDLAPDENDAVQPLLTWSQGMYDLEGDGDDAEGSSSVCWNFGDMSESLINNGIAASDAASTASGYVPPPFRGMTAASIITATPFVTTTSPPSNAGSCYVPPHLRGITGAPTGTSRPSVAATISHPTARIIPPHLRVIAEASTVRSVATGTYTIAPSNVGNDYVPPYMRSLRISATGPPSTKNSRPGTGGDIISTTSSISNPWEDRSTVTSSGRAAARPAIPFTGWDSAGNSHQQYRLPSGSTTATQPSAQSPAWGSGSATTPAHRPLTSTQPPRSNSNWVKSFGTKNVGPKYTPQPPPTTQATRRLNNGYDSDGSIDEM